MIGIGFLFYRKTKNFSDYILGGRKLGSWTTALSAQASDMSGWLLLGLPGAAYTVGIEAAWIGLGLAVGTYINWKVVAKRLRKYTEISRDSLTLSDFFENRFRDNTRILRVVSAFIILIFFTVYTSAQFSAGGKLFETLIGIPYTTALVIGVIVIIAYTFLGGFMAVAMTDFIQGLLMFFALIIVPFVAIAELGGFGSTFAQMRAVDSNYLSFFMSTGSEGKIAIIAIISNLAWGLGYFGQPHILARFMAIRTSSDIKKARIIAMVWVVITLVAAVTIGMVGRIYFTNGIADPEKVFMLMANNMFTPIIGGILLAAILAASMSTADSQLLVTASAISEDFYKQFFRKGASDVELIWVGRTAVAMVAFVAMLIAFDPNSSVFGLVSYAWAGLGAAFGPVIITSLFWKRMNKWGAIAGMVSGAVSVIVWKAIAVSAPAGSFWTVYELLPAFIIAIIAIFIVTMTTAEPPQEVIDEFESVAISKI